MNIVSGVLLILGIGTCARGVYALVKRDIVDEGEPMVGPAAARHGAILVVIGLVVASNAIFEWPWLTALVGWVRQLE
jgi:hypothetical protein